MKPEYIKLVVLTVIGVSGYIAWAVMAYFDPLLRPDFLRFNIFMVTGVVGLALREMQAPGIPPSKEVTPPNA